MINIYKKIKYLNIKISWFENYLYNYEKMDKLIKLNSNEYLFGLSCFFMVCIIYKLYCEYTKNSKIQFNVMN